MTAFFLVCFLGMQLEGGIYFKNVNHCVMYKDKLHNQVVMKGQDEQKYQCMCKLVPNIDPSKVKVY
tara:strand:+ start:77 stop:274 length:198 start_codon:yes stop_codon:yes gene_type:complete